jgi:hypothetical protein
VTYLRSYVTGSNDAILNQVGKTMAVFLVRAHHGPGGASGHGSPMVRNLPTVKPKIPLLGVISTATPLQGASISINLQ